MCHPCSVLSLYYVTVSFMRVIIKTRITGILLLDSQSIAFVPCYVLFLVFGLFVCFVKSKRNPFDGHPYQIIGDSHLSGAVTALFSPFCLGCSLTL